MLGRRNKQAVLVEVERSDRASSRPGALGHAELQAYTELAGKLAKTGSVFLTGPAKGIPRDGALDPGVGPRAALQRAQPDEHVRSELMETSRGRALDPHR